MITMMLVSKSYVGIATHDKLVVDRSLEKIQSLKFRKQDYEFQMLLGVTEKFRAEIIKRYHRLRVYVPFGEYWYAYSMKRLKKNPGIAGHIIKNLFIRG